MITNLAEIYYNKRGLKQLKKSFAFYELFGPILYDAYNRRIETGPILPIQIGKKITFFRRSE